MEIASCELLQTIVHAQLMDSQQDLLVQSGGIALV